MHTLTISSKNKQTHPKYKDAAQSKRGQRKKTASANANTTLTEILQLLSDLSLLRNAAKSKYVHILQTLELAGTISYNKRGAIFATLNGAPKNMADVVIQPETTLGALPGDQILVRLENYSSMRMRLMGRVIRVIRRARSMYRMRLLETPPARSLQSKILCGVLLDMQPANIGAAILLADVPTPDHAKLQAGAIIIARLRETTAAQAKTFFERRDPATGETTTAA